MKILHLFFILTLAILQAYTVTSIDLSDQAKEYPEKKRVVLGEIKTHFPQSVKVIHALVHLQGVGRQDPVTIRWIAEDALPQPNQVIAEAEGELEPHTSMFHTFLEQGPKQLPPGHYRIELLENGKLAGSKQFTILPPKRVSRDKTSQAFPAEDWKIYLASDIRNNSDGTIRPLGISNHFANSQHTIYAVIPFKGMRKGTPYSIVWRVLDDGHIHNAELLRKNGIFNRSEGSLVGKISLPRDWPDGQFQVTLNIKGESVANKAFTIGNYPRQTSRSSISPSIPDTVHQMQMIQNLAQWMLQSIEDKTLEPIKEHSSRAWQEQIDLDKLNRNFSGIFNARMSWREIFAQTPKLRAAHINQKGLLVLQAVYPGVHSVDVLLEGDYLYEDGAWRLFGFALEPVKPAS